MLCAWKQAASMLRASEITQDEYDRWRYRYPEFDTTQRWAKVPSQARSDSCWRVRKHIIHNTMEAFLWHFQKKQLPVLLIFVTVI